MTQLEKSSKDIIIDVCENVDATWMYFTPFARHKTRTGFQIEGIWTNHPIANPGKQMIIENTI